MPAAIMADGHSGAKIAVRRARGAPRPGNQKTAMEKIKKGIT